MVSRSIPGPWWGYILVGIATVFWGTTGIFFKLLAIHYQLGSLTIAFLRASMVALYGFIFLAIFDRSSLRLQRRDILLLLLLGGVGVALFHSLIVYSAVLTTVAMAWVLQYTAPAMVTLISWQVFGESLNRLRGIVLMMTFMGCLLVVRAYDPAQLRLNWLGIMCGLGAGLCYALFTLLSKRALARYRSVTVVTYSFIFGALCLSLTQLADIPEMVSYPFLAWVLVLIMAVMTFGGYLCYTLGLRRLPASVASIVATMDPAVATVLAFLILGESLTRLQVLGEALILGGVILLQINSSN